MKVLISGAGISGTALAFWLAKLDFDVTVVERFPSLRTNGLQLDLRGFGIQVLRRMGLDAAFKARCAPEQGMQIVNSAGTRLAYLAANAPGGGGGKQNFTSEYEIMRGDLCRLFHEASIAAAGGSDKVKYLFDTSIKEIQDKGKDGVRVLFSNNQTDTFDLVVGADGQWSRTRRMMLNNTTAAAPDEALHLLPGMYAGYFTTPIPIQPGEGNDSTLYLASRGRSIMTRRSDPAFIQVYMMCSPGAKIQTARRGDTALEKEAFADNYEGAGWRAPELVEGMRAADDFYCERLGLVKCAAWHRGRVALVGDAAWCPSVLTGMGTTSSVVGAYILAGELSKILSSGSQNKGGGGSSSSSSSDGHAGLEEALVAYETKFRPFMDQVQHGVGEESLMAKLLMPSSAIGIALLHLFLRVVTFLGINLSSSSFMKEDIRDWELPQYKAFSKE